MSSPKEYEISQVTNPVLHAEGPVWHPVEDVLYYVDTFNATAFRWDPTTNVTTNHKLEGRNSIGTIMPIRGKKNEFVVSADRYIYHLKWDGSQNNTGKVTEILMIENDKPRNQFNDGKTDVNGNIWLGTLTRKEDLGVEPHGGSLYRFVPSKKSYTYEEKISKVSISNGLIWSVDNSHFFHIDSLERTVMKYEFDVGSGTISNERVLFNLADYPDIDGIPDGMTSDSDGNLYVAIFGGSAVLKIDPNSGKLLQTIKMPVKYVTSVVFGGNKLDVLYVTTSKLKENESDISATYPAGAVFAVTGLNTVGYLLHEPIA